MLLSELTLDMVEALLIHEITRRWLANQSFAA